MLCALSGFATPGGPRCLAPVLVPWLWPAACLSGVPRGSAWCAAPRPVRSLSVLQLAFPTPWCLSPPRGLGPPALLGGCAGHAEAGRKPGSLCLPLATAEAGTLGSLRVVPVRGPAMGLSLAGPSGAGLGLRALRWLACVDPVTDTSCFLYRPSFDGGLGRCTGAVSCGRRHLPLRVGGRHARVPCLCACARPSWPGRAGRPPGRVLVRLTFFFWPPCLSALRGPLWAGVAPFVVLCLPSPHPFCFCFVFFCFFVCPFFFALRPLCLYLFLVSGPGALGLGALRFFFAGLKLLSSPCALAFFVLPCQGPLSAGCPPQPPPSLAVVAVPRCLALVLFSPFSPLVRAPLVSVFLCFPAAGDLGLGAGLCRLCALASFVLSPWPLAAPWWLPPPRPLCVSRFSSLPLAAVCRVLCCAVCPWVRYCAALLRVVPPGVVLSCAVLLFCGGLVPLLVAPCPLALPIALGPCALPCCVVRCSPALCAVCCVCFLVAWLCVLLFAALLCAVCVPGCCAVRSLSSPLRTVLCFAVLVRLRCAVRVVRVVAGAWCCGALLCVVLFPLVCCGAVLGLVARGCLLVACLGVRVPVWPRGLLPCGWRGLLWCPASLCRVLWCCAVPWCCAVVLCCRVVVLLALALPSCGLLCCAVLCCWLAVLFFARWWCPRAVVLFRSCCAYPVFSALCAAVPCCAGCGALLPCVVCCGAVLWCGAVLLCSAVVLRCCFCVLCPPVACRAAPCCAVLCCWLSVLFLARRWRLCAVVPFPSLPARTKKINYLTCHPALVAVSWLACLGGCGVLDLTRRTFHLQQKGGESVEGGAQAGGEGTWRIKEGVRDEYRGAACFENFFSVFYALLATQFSLRRRRIIRRRTSLTALFVCLFRFKIFHVVF